MGQNAGKQPKSPAPKPKPLAKKLNPTLNRDLPLNRDPPLSWGLPLNRDPPWSRDLSLNRDPPPPYPPLHAEIITTEEIQTDIRTLTWNTANFTKLRHLIPKAEELGWLSTPTRELIWSHPFKAGEGTPTPTDWMLDIRINKYEELQFRLNLESAEADTTIAYGYTRRRMRLTNEQQKVSAYFKPSVKDPEDPTKILFHRNVGLREYVVDKYRHKYRSYTEYKKWMKLATMQELESSGALTGDILSIGIHLEIYRQSSQIKSVTSTTTSKMGEASRSQPVTSTDPEDPIPVNSTAIKEMGKTHFEQLLKTGKGADFILRVREHPFKVHKAILSQNPIFAEMMESEMVEKKSGEIDSLTIDDFSLSPLCLNVVLHFIYTGSVHEDWKLIPEEVNKAADKYGLPLLKKELLKDKEWVTDDNV